MRYALAWSTLLIPLLCSAQDAPVNLPTALEAPKPTITFSKAPSLAEAAAREEANERAFYDYPLGRTFWYKPSKTRAPVRFYQRIEPSPALYKGFELAGEIRPDVTVSFKVLARIQLSPAFLSGRPHYALRVEFEEGSQAFVDEGAFGIYQRGQDPGPNRTAVSGDPADVMNEYNRLLFEDDPVWLARQVEAQRAGLARERAEADAAYQARLAAYQAERAREAAQAEAEAEARRIAELREYKRKGGFKLGMSQKRVLASNWGEPRDVRRTTGRFGVHEQWVYGGGRYLYFENGVLTTIQE